MSVPQTLLLSLSSLVLFAAGCIHFEGGADIDDGPGQPDASVDAGTSPDAEPVPTPVFSCEEVDAELEHNCGLAEPCADFSSAERVCIDGLMTQEWARPPCEEYAACLSVPLFECQDIEEELSLNCEIEVDCEQLEFGDRFCISALMNMLWSNPPCEEYATCLDR